MFESYERLFNSIRSMWQRRCLKDSFSKVFTRITLLAGEMFFLTWPLFCKICKNFLNASPIKILCMIQLKWKTLGFFQEDENKIFINL